MSIHEYLSADHDRLDALLVRAVADPDAYREFRLGLLRHIAMEEKVLFAELRQRGDAAVVELVRQLHADHAAIASLLVPTPTPALLAMLRDVLEEHNPLEDAPGGLYALCDQAASAPQLMDRMLAIPPVRAAAHVDEPRVHEHIERMLAARKHTSPRR